MITHNTQSVPLRNLRLEGHAALSLQPISLAQQESGHPTLRREHTKRIGKG